MALRRLLVLTSAVIFFDTLFFAALTPLLPHYADALHMSQTGAGVLAAAYPAGALIGAIPSGMVAARAGVKPTVIVGLSAVAVCTVVFGIANAAWQLDTARFVQGLSSSFTWTGALAWLVSATPAGRRGTLIGQAFAAAVFGALVGPVLGGIASVAGTGWTFGAIGVGSLGLVAWAAATPAELPLEPQRMDALAQALRDPRVLEAAWFIVLGALLFGTLAVLAPLRLSALGLGSVAIGAVFLAAAAVETVTNVFAGRIADRTGPIRPILWSLAASAVLAALLPWPGRALVLVPLVVVSGLAFGLFFTPGSALLTQLSEARGLDYGYTFALIILAWAPGQALGSAGGGALANISSDAVPYLLLSAVCCLTLVWVRRSQVRT